MVEQGASVLDAFERALGKILARVCVSVGNGEPFGRHGSGLSPPNLSHSASMPRYQPAIAIAYSGGLDSSVLLHLAHDYAATRDIKLFAFHVHHGISPNADDWLAHCQCECARLDIVFDVRRINLVDQDKSGIEEAARISRYAALGDLCRIHNVPLLLTAHHLDDQAETVLLQLLRGCGVAGLSGMDVANTAPGLLDDDGLVMARPLLGISRTALADFVASKNISYVEDESNTDSRYARNALRHQAMPSLSEYFPGFQQRVARTAQHAQSAQRLLSELAAQDLAVCSDGACLDVNHVKQLGPDRVDNLLRYWFGSRGFRMPSTAWLDEMRTQLLGAKADAQLCVTHADCHVRRYRDRIYLTSKLGEAGLNAPPLEFRWNGEAQMHFPGYGGNLYFDEAEEGVDANWLRNQLLRIHHRSGGERLKLAINRPTKNLKHHYQALDVPAWERERLPLVSAADQLLFVAGIGMDCHRLDSGPGSRIRFRWQHDDA